MVEEISSSVNTGVVMAGVEIRAVERRLPTPIRAVSTLPAVLELYIGKPESSNNVTGVDDPELLVLRIAATVELFTLRRAVVGLVVCGVLDVATEREPVRG